MNSRKSWLFIYYQFAKKKYFNNSYFPIVFTETKEQIPVARTNDYKSASYLFSNFKPFENCAIVSKTFL